MNKRVVVDTGPLVAIVREREEAHVRCVEALKTISSPLLTCWPVLTEAAYLLRREPGGMKALGLLLEKGALKLVDMAELEFLSMLDYMDRYRSIGAQLADAAVVYIAEREKVDAVFTLDVRDFSVYRTAMGQPLTILPVP